MVANGGGSIVNLSSIAGVIGSEHVHMAYNATLLHGSAGLSVLCRVGVEDHSPFGERNFAGRWSRLLFPQAYTGGKSG
jgi:hypothetical protein